LALDKLNGKLHALDAPDSHQTRCCTVPRVGLDMLVKAKIAVMQGLNSGHPICS